MALNLRLVSLKLRQKLNFRLVKLLLFVIYLAATFSFIIHNISGSQGNGAEEFLVEVNTSEKFKYHFNNLMTHDISLIGQKISARSFLPN